MWVCMRIILRSYFAAVSLILSMYSNHMPKDEAGPPTFVRFVPPEPSPGLMRTPTSEPRAILP